MTHDRDRIRSEIHRLPIDPEPTDPLIPHPLTLVRRDADLLPVIAAGGALGSLARWTLAQLLPTDGFSWATFVTNVLGCALIGVLMALMVDRWSGTRYRRPFLGVGVLGGFTTFSTAQVDTHRLLADGRPALAVLYAVVTLLCCLGGVWAGLTGCRTVLDRAGGPETDPQADPETESEAAR